MLEAKPKAKSMFVFEPMLMAGLELKLEVKLEAMLKVKLMVKLMVKHWFMLKQRATVVAKAVK